VPEENEHHASTRPSVDHAIRLQLQRGFAFHQEGRLVDAGRIYGGILQHAPDHFDALHLLGVIACQNRSYEQAVLLISKAISINPHVALAHFNRASALQELRRLEEALASYDKAIALRPDFAEPYSNRGNVLQELRRFEEALVSYDKAIALKPGFAEPYSNRGNVLQELGRLEEALVSYNKAIALRPDYAEAYSNCGVTFYELKRFEEAVVSCDKAIALKPDFAEAYSNRGNAFKELNRLEEALFCYDKAIALNPNYAEAHSNRGNVLKELRRYEEALVSSDKAIALKPDFADAYSSRGNALYELDRLDEALVSFEKAIALKSILADAYSNMGRVLNARGRLEEARAAFLKAIDIVPMNVGAYFNLADSMTFASGDPHLAAMQKLVVAPEGLSKTDRIKLNFALGKAYADLKDQRRSFLHLLAANAGKRAMISYDEPAALALFDRIEATFSRELIAAKSGGGDPSQRPIFVLGMPRSGTTLVEQILASHPMVHGAGELETLSEVVLAVRNPGSTTIPYPDFVPALDRAALMSIGAHYLAAINDRAPGGERVTDKMPSNYYFAGLIHLALPNAKIIHTVRHPLDTCISCFSKLFAGAQNHTYDLGELGRYYKRYERLMTHWRRVLPPERILDVRYEDVVEDLETQARRIISYCGLPWDDRCLSFHETDRPVRTASVTQVRQPIYSNAVGRWRGYEEFIGPLLTALDLPERSDR
jgi:tetratricopeptide (TPR) repeat protein